jgi:hypothetical protein
VECIVRRYITSTAVILACTLLHVVPAGAQDAAPDARSIVARHQQAVGGLDAHAAVRSLHSTGELAIPSAGITGTLEVWQARPNRTAMRVDIPGWGTVSSGFTGVAGWTLSSTEGARLMTGAEALQAADDAHFDSLLRAPALVDSLVYLERTAIAGQTCDRVRVVWRSGRVSSDCFAVDSGLLVASSRSQLSGDAAADATVLYADYRAFGSIRIPTRITTIVSGIEQVVTLLTVSLDDVADDALTPPPAIRALIRG